jgi:hypothetical protein
MADDREFYMAVLNAGAILTGFCGTFLQFRIQREAAYYRQPALSFEKGEARDINIGLSHFTSSFLLIIIATLAAIAFGLVLPLLALSNALFTPPRIISGGLLFALVFVVGYFFAELIHYHILSTRLLNDWEEWGRQKWTVLCTLILAILVFCTVWSGGTCMLDAVGWIKGRLSP